MGTVKLPPTTTEELARAVAAGRRRRSTERRAASVRYNSKRDAIEIELSDGSGIRLPRAMVEEFRGVPSADMAALRVSPGGYGISLDKHDIDISVHGLVSSLATPKDMATALGRLGGTARTEVKRVSARSNGAKGGRPKKVHQLA
jgi:hypothetical protein